MVSRLIRLFRRGDEDLDCGEVRGLSSDYIDGELDPAVSERVKGHLDWCGPCSSFVNTLRATIGMLRASPKREVPDDFRAGVRERLEAERRMR